MAGISVLEIADQLGLRLAGDGSLVVDKVSALEEADAQSLIYIEKEQFAAKAEISPAQVVLVPSELSEAVKNIKAVLISDDVKSSLIDVLELLYPEEKPAAGTDPSAVIEKGASVSSGAIIGPLCHISSTAVIEEGACLWSNIYVGPYCTVGRQCVLHPGVVLRRNVRLEKAVTVHANTVIGEDGFGYHQGNGGIRKIPQIGQVRIEDDVEIGASVTIDRGALGTTIIGKGTKIDNLVQIAHNVVIGQYNLIVAQVGISGSVCIGNGCILAGQVGVVDHAVIEDGAIAAAQSGVSKRGIKQGQAVLGSPARPIQEEKRIWSSLEKVPGMIKDIRKIKKLLAGD